MNLYGFQQDMSLSLLMMNGRKLYRKLIKNNSKIWTPDFSLILLWKNYTVYVKGEK